MRAVLVTCSDGCHVGIHRGRVFVLISAIPDAWLYCARYMYPTSMDRMFVKAPSSYLSQIENPSFHLRASKEVRGIEAMLDTGLQNREQG
ncbi:hypothetical protein HDU84_001875, partial [Entophlyctis sp. JEL0112]